MRMRTAAFVSAIALLCVTAATAATDARLRRTTLAFAPNGRLSLTTHNGSVTVTTWNQPRIDVQARIEPGDSDHPEDVDNVDVRVTGSGSSVRVETNYDKIPWRSSWFFGGTSRTLPPVHYTIALPPGATVDIEDHNATVRVAGVQGDVRVNAHNGAIDLNGVGGGVDIDAHNADVRITYSRFARPAQIETHNGGIDIRLPSDARFNLNASGHHIDLDSDFPVVARQLDRDSYIGNVNGGGPELRLSTHNGALRLKRS